MDDYRITIENEIDSDTDEMFNTMIWITLKFYKDDILVGKFSIINDNIECTNMILQEQNIVLNTFIDNVTDGVDDTLNFRQINGEIKIVYKDPYVIFHISGEMYECEFTVVKNDELVYALNFIKK